MLLRPAVVHVHALLPLSFRLVTIATITAMKGERKGNDGYARGMDRAQAILDAALELFAEDGFAAVGVDRIGERAGIPGPHIYRHFSGKGELLATLIDQAMD